MNAAIRASYALLQEGVETRVLFLGNNYDPDDFFQEEKDSKAIFKERIKNALHPIAFIVEQKEILKQSATERSVFVDECLTEIKLVSDSIIQSDLIKRLSNAISIPESELLHRLDSIKTKRYRQVSDEKAEIKSTHYTSLSDKAQLELIKIAIHYPEHIQDINITLFDNPFLNDVMKAIAKNNGKNNNQAQLLQMIGGNEEERNLIVSLAVSGHEKEDKDQILEDCLLILEHRLKRKLHYYEIKLDALKKMILCRMLVLLLN